MTEKVLAAARPPVPRSAPNSFAAPCSGAWYAHQSLFFLLLKRFAFSQSTHNVRSFFPAAFFFSRVLPGPRAPQEQSRAFAPPGVLLARQDAAAGIGYLDWVHHGAVRAGGSLERVRH